MDKKVIFFYDTSSFYFTLSLNESTFNFAAHKISGMSHRCWPHAKALLCFHTFPLCGSDKKTPANRRFCQDECRFLEQYVCRNEFYIAKGLSTISQFVPSCGTLPKPGTPGHSDCLKLPTLDESSFRK